MSRKHALITGVGPGTGAALARRLAAGGYDVAMIARDKERLDTLESEISGARGFAANVRNVSEFDQALDEAHRAFGDPELVIHNAVAGAYGNFMEIKPSVLERNFQINVMAFLQLARRVAPAMIEAGKGTIIATGNTASRRGKSAYAGFAPTKAAQRILAESIARELGPKGVHVAYVLIDAVIDVPWTRAARPGAPDDFFIQPADIAEEIWNLAHQPRSAWSFNVELRPYGEVW